VISAIIRLSETASEEFDNWRLSVHIVEGDQFPSFFLRELLRRTLLTNCLFESKYFKRFNCRGPSTLEEEEEASIIEKNSTAASNGKQK
jgi:hypothetical protein